MEHSAVPLQGSNRSPTTVPAAVSGFRGGLYFENLLSFSRSDVLFVSIPFLPFQSEQ